MLYWSPILEADINDCPTLSPCAAHRLDGILHPCNSCGLDSRQPCMGAKPTTRSSSHAREVRHTADGRSVVETCRPLRDLSSQLSGFERRRRRRSQRNHPASRLPAVTWRRFTLALAHL